MFHIAVISVPHKVAEKLEPSDDSSGPSLVDYSEKRSLPISIPDYNTHEKDREKFVVRIILLVEFYEKINAFCDIWHCCEGNRSMGSQLDFSLIIYAGISWLG